MSPNFCSLVSPKAIASLLPTQTSTPASAPSAASDTTPYVAGRPPLCTRVPCWHAPVPSRAYMLWRLELAHAAGVGLLLDGCIHPGAQTAVTLVAALAMSWVLRPCNSSLPPPPYTNPHSTPASLDWQRYTAPVPAGICCSAFDPAPDLHQQTHKGMHVGQYWLPCKPAETISCFCNEPAAAAKPCRLGVGGCALSGAQALTLC